MSTAIDPASLIAEAEGIGGEDMRQEYMTLRLEGHTRAEARQLCGGARQLETRNKQRGPLVGGMRPLVSDFREVEDIESLTMDHREPDERDATWDAIDHAKAVAATMLDSLPQEEADALRSIYGIGGDNPTDWASTIGLLEARRQRYNAERVAARKSAPETDLKAPERKAIVHGTNAGYQAHHRREGRVECADCIDGRNAYQKLAARKRRALARTITATDTDKAAA
jgi:hypothetical protein